MKNKNLSIYVNKEAKAKYEKLAQFFDVPVTMMIRQVLTMDEVLKVVDSLISTCETLDKMKAEGFFNER